MEGFQRIFAATIFFGTADEPNGKPVLDWARLHFFDRMCLWFHKGDGEPVGSGSGENSIVLSEAFYEEIDQHWIPVEREVIAALANAPGELDLYLWVAWKTWSLKGRSLIHRGRARRPTRIDRILGTALLSKEAGLLA